MNSAAEDDELMATKDVARWLGYTRQGIGYLLRKGTLPGYKVGGVWRIARKDIERYLEQHRNNVKSELG